MANYVALGAGLRDIGGIASGVSDFLQRERQLDQGDRRLGQADRELDMRQEAQDHTIRQQKNQAYGRQLMGVINEAAQAARPDGTKFQDLGEYLESDVGASARERLTNALADSNSQYRAQLKGAPVRTVRNADGRFVVEAKQGDTWAPVVGAEGQPVSFSGTELAQKARLDAASAGVAEIIYFKRQAKQALDSGQLTPEEYQAQVSQLDSSASGLLDRAEASGLPRDQVVETARMGDPANWQRPEAQQSRLGQALGTAVPVASRVAGAAGVGAGALAGLGTFAREMARSPEGAAPDTMIPLPEPTAAVMPNNMGMGAFDPARAAVASPTATPAESQPGSTQATVPVAPEWAAPLGPDANKVVQPTEQNTRPVQQETRASRAQQSVTRAMSPNASASDGRDAALQYANAMTIMGHPPNPTILSNLYAGDDMRGSAAEAAAQELQYFKAAVKNKATGTLDFANTLKLREQIAKERTRAAEVAAEAAIGSNMPERAAAVKQLSNAIELGMSTHNNDLKIMGIDTSQLMSSMATLPMVSDLLAKYYIEDMGAARHNAQTGWFGTKKERTTLMNKVLKEVSVMDPAAFRRQVYLGLVSNREPGMAADDPKLIEAARKTIEYYENMETPTHGYDAGTSQ
jgi:hypothetical protein